ncbi:MAG: GNAT family N-acetyltransferase [Chloroflexota bacterium]|nr:GNAT family N-acetyltransferase [Chloroflexota bacterium]
MTNDAAVRNQTPHDLGDGLVLRCGTLSDIEAVAALNGELHADSPQTFSAGIAAWTRDLMNGTHPLYQACDWTVVEDTRSGRIVSTMCLLSQVWAYSGIPFGVGRPELVGTLPEYRRRGLVRAQLTVLHEWSARRGELVQGITGIPWYYRQFGYELGGLTLGGAQTGYLPLVPELPAGTEEPFSVRDAAERDLSFIGDLYRQRILRDRVACIRDEAVWRYELDRRDPSSEVAVRLAVLASTDGTPVGYLAHAGHLRNGAILLGEYELIPKTSWAAATPVVIRYLAARGAEYAARDGQQFKSYSFGLGSVHPSYEVAAEHLPHVRMPYAWYLRVPDIPLFLQHIAPSLELRLAASSWAGHTGQLNISFYREGIRLAFTEGRITALSWNQVPDDRRDAAFPGLTFLQLVFGYRALDEISYAFADCQARSDGSKALLNALFPKQASNIWAVA